MTDKTNRTLTDDEIAVLTEYRDEAGYKDSRVKWQTISEHLHARGYLELNPIQKPGHRQYVLTPAGRRALHGDAPSDEAEPNTPPETEAEVDAYLRAHGYDPEALAAEARAKFGSPLTPAPSTDAVTFDALQNSEREAYGRFCITAPNTDEGKQAERDLYRTRSDLCDFIDSHAATIRAALTVEPTRTQASCLINRIGCYTIKEIKKAGSQHPAQSTHRSPIKL